MKPLAFTAPTDEPPIPKLVRIPISERGSNYLSRFIGSEIQSQILYQPLEYPLPLQSPSAPSGVLPDPVQQSSDSASKFHIQPIAVSFPVSPDTPVRHISSQQPSMQGSRLENEIVDRFTSLVLPQIRDTQQKTQEKKRALSWLFEESSWQLVVSVLSQHQKRMLYLKLLHMLYVNTKRKMALQQLQQHPPYDPEEGYSVTVMRLLACLLMKLASACSRPLEGEPLAQAGELKIEIYVSEDQIQLELDPVTAQKRRENLETINLLHNRLREAQQRLTTLKAKCGDTLHNYAEIFANCTQLLERDDVLPLQGEASRSIRSKNLTFGTGKALSRLSRPLELSFE